MTPEEHVPAAGSTAYLRLVQLGSGGGGTLRLVIRYHGSDWSRLTRVRSRLTGGRHVGPRGKAVVRLEESQLAEMRQVFTAYSHWQNQL